MTEWVPLYPWNVYPDTLSRICARIVSGRNEISKSLARSYAVRSLRCSVLQPETTRRKDDATAKPDVGASNNNNNDGHHYDNYAETMQETILHLASVLQNQE